MESNLVNDVPLGSLFHILPLASYLDFLSFLLSIMYCDLKPNKPVLFQLLLVTVFFIAMKSKVGKKWVQEGKLLSGQCWACCCGKMVELSGGELTDFSQNMEKNIKSSAYHRGLTCEVSKGSLRFYQTLSV